MKLKYFSNVEWALWLSSLLFIIISFLAFGGDGYLTLAASLVGATSLIYCAKGQSYRTGLNDNIWCALLYFCLTICMALLVGKGCKSGNRLEIKAL